MLNLLKLFLGIILGLLILGTLSASAGYYFFVNSVSIKPKKPVFAEESKSKITAPVAPKVTAKPSEEPAASPTTEPEEAVISPSPVQELPPGAYPATVTWSSGVNLRKEPLDSSDKTGSVGFKEKIAVIQENADKSWAQVRNADGSVEGWLKMGNIAKDAGNQQPDAPANTSGDGQNSGN